MAEAPSSLLERGSLRQVQGVPRRLVPFALVLTAYGWCTHYDAPPLWLPARRCFQVPGMPHDQASDRDAHGADP